MRSDLLKVVICGAALALAGLGVAQGKLTGVETRKTPTGLKLQIKGSGLKTPKTIKGHDGKSWSYQFNASLAGKGKVVPVNANGLKAYSFSSHKSSPNLVRVVFWPSTKTKPTIAKNKEGWLISWPSSKATVQAYQPKPTKSTPSVAGISHSKKALVKTDKVTIKPVKSNGQQILPITVAKPATKTGSKPAAKPKTGNKGGLVSLDFVNTDIVQILKALAMQSRVNIVTSPDVKGTLTVSLGKVTVRDALDLVTTLSGLAYQFTGNTYIVASKDKIVGMVGDLERTGPTIVTSNVVPIFSGEGTQIKAAILRTMSPQTEKGSFELILPSEETKVEKKTDANSGAQQADKSLNDKAETKVESKATSGVKDLYVVVIGAPERVDEVSKMVKSLDRQFCSVEGVTIPTSTALVTRAYQVRGGSAAELAKAVAGESNKVGNVSISATPATSKSEQVIVMNGRANEVDGLMHTLAQLDSSEQLGGEFHMYEVKYADPRALREAVVAQVPGLRASIPPASSGNPRLFQSGDMKNQAMDRIKDATGNAGNSNNGTGAVVGDPKVSRDSGDITEGLAQPFTDLETAGVPMRLLLRGTSDQIRSAQAYMAMVDTAPKQLALELRVMEMSKEDALRVGLDWSIFTGGAVSLLRLNQSLNPLGSNQASAGGTWGGGQGGASVTATLDSIADRNRLIARPNLLAIDGRESEIFVGDIVRYVSNKSTNPTTGELQITISEVPVGVRLAVMPRIGGDGSITIDLRPVVSSITGFLDAGAGIKIPQTSSRTAQSTVNIMSGETIAIGGLIQETDVRSVSKVPLLGDLPVIGMLFRRTDNSKVRREVVFFLTARQVSAQDRHKAADPRDAEGKNPVEMGKLKNGGG